jgi:hypothetical protein
MLPALAEAMNGHARDPDGRERIPPGCGGPPAGPAAPPPPLPPNLAAAAVTAAAD